MKYTDDNDVDGDDDEMCALFYNHNVFVIICLICLEIWLCHC